jgi:acyl carrier protein
MRGVEDLTMSDWDDRYAVLLREHLPELPEGTTLESDTDLAAAGLDSVQLINLVVALEAEYAVTFADEHFTNETFDTAGAVWKTLQELRDETSRSGGNP